MRKSYKNSGLSVIFIIIFVALILGVAFIIAWQNLNQPKTPPSVSGSPEAAILRTQAPAAQTPTPKPTIYPLIADKGTAGTYNVSQGPHSGPTFRQIIFDPLDVKKGQNLKINVAMESAGGVSTVKGTFTMDSSKEDLTFTKVSRQGEAEVWEVQFTLKDSVDYKYILNVSATDAKGTSTISVAPRS